MSYTFYWKWKLIKKHCPYLGHQNDARLMWKNRIPRSCRIGPRDRTSDPRATPPGVSNRKPKVHVSSWLQTSQQYHVRLTNGIVSRTWQCFHSDVQPTHLTCIMSKLQFVDNELSYWNLAILVHLISFVIADLSVVHILFK